MKMELLDWQSSLLNIGGVGLPRNVEVEGRFDSLIGSRPAFANLRMRFENAEEFCADAKIFENDSRFSEYAQYAIYGALDVFMTVHVYAISKVKITLIEIDEDQVKSTPRAFRLAGRDAAKRALAASGLLV